MPLRMARSVSCGSQRSEVLSAGKHLCRCRRRAIRDLKPDLIHAHDFSMATCAAWAAGKTPVVAHFHNNPLWLKKVCPQSVALALSLPRIRNVISVSNSIEAEYIFRGLLKQKNTVVGNVVNCADVRQKAQETCNCAQVDLVFLGRMTDPKCPSCFARLCRGSGRSGHRLPHA